MVGTHLWVRMARALPGAPPLLRRPPTILRPPTLLLLRAPQRGLLVRGEASQAHHAAGASHLVLVRLDLEPAGLALVEARAQVAGVMLPRLYLLLELREPLLGEPRRLQR